MIPSTVERVPRHTSDSVNRQIRDDMEARIRYLEAHPQEIDRRLEDLDREWDIERFLEANAATLALAGLALATAVDKRWLVLPAVVVAFLLQHAIQGWCPPVPILRRLGFRTSREIEIERHALKVLRGDYDLSSARDQESAVHQALHAARL
jgi:hypothetical protein